MADTIALKGIGHFTLWFLVGYLLFICCWRHFCVRRDVLTSGPFLPLILGTIAATPYILQTFGIVSRESAHTLPFMIFLLYPLTDQSAWVEGILGNFHLNVILLGMAYLHLVIHYIRLIRKLRQLSCSSVAKQR